MNQPADKARRGDPVRRLTDRLLPDGLCWLPTEGLAHPEAARAPLLAFLFLVGRLAQGGAKRTVREAELVSAICLAAGDDEESLPQRFEQYARHVVAVVPTAHARLTGAVAATWHDALTIGAKT